MFPIILSALAIILLVSAYLAYKVKIKAHLKRDNSELANKICHMSPYGHQGEKHHYQNIESELAENFDKTYFTLSEKRKIIQHYASFEDDARKLVSKMYKNRLHPSSILCQYLEDIDGIDAAITGHNEKILMNLLAAHQNFFDHCLDYPLDCQQRRAVVSEEDNCLVVSSAGSGKTSSIVGKVKYLTEIKHVDPKRILLISYTNKAAAELTERMNTPGLRGYTFHKLAMDIIAHDTGSKPSICDNTDQLFVDIFHELQQNPIYMKSVLSYFVDYPIEESEREKRLHKRREKLAEIKSAQLKAVFPDMDGKAIHVRSEQERKICFVLSALGLRYRYEEPYEIVVTDELHSQYRPDFSIYYERDGKLKRIYLEHYGVDENNHVPEWFADEKEISYDEANKKYNDGITWKKYTHEKYHTDLITTTSADFKFHDIKTIIKSLLKSRGIPYEEKTDEELYQMVLPKGSKQEKAFIRLIATFSALLKSSCRNIWEVIRTADTNSDERSAFIIKNIFQPVYQRYSTKLRENNQIDFTDAILQATDICRTKHPLSFDYIIVDEFQDISVDRYQFLRVLRAGNPPAKLYCVGDDWQSIYRFSGSDMSLFNRFSEYFGLTEINKIETTYRFGEPLVTYSSRFIQRNNAQIKKNIHPFQKNAKTQLEFYPYNRENYCLTIENIISQIPSGKSVFLLGRYSFDDYYLSYKYSSFRRGTHFFYVIAGREIEFLTVHKSKGLEADYVILLQCNKDIYGFPSLVADDPCLNYLLTQDDPFPFAEERRLFYVAITRAKSKTIVMYNPKIPSVFVDEFLHPEQLTEFSYLVHPNANKRWTKAADDFLLILESEGHDTKYISRKMGRSQTSIALRLAKLHNRR